MRELKCLISGIQRAAAPEVKSPKHDDTGRVVNRKDAPGRKAPSNQLQWTDSMNELDEGTVSRCPATTPLRPKPERKKKKMVLIEASGFKTN